MTAKRGAYVRARCTLPAFLAPGAPIAANLRVPGLRTCVARRTRLRGQRTLDLLLIDAARPGNGAFTRLLARVPATWAIHVDNVTTAKFARGLVRRGFVAVARTGGPCFFRSKR